MFLKGLRILLYLCLMLGAVVYPLASNSFPGSGASANSLAAQRYTLDASHSKFIAHALRGGLFWFNGHDRITATIRPQRVMHDGLARAVAVAIFFQATFSTNGISG